MAETSLDINSRQRSIHHSMNLSLSPKEREGNFQVKLFAKLSHHMHIIGSNRLVSDEIRGKYTLKIGANYTYDPTDFLDFLCSSNNESHHH